MDELAIRMRKREPFVRDGESVQEALERLVANSEYDYRLHLLKKPEVPRQSPPEK
jgi:hypothetical protein